MPSYDVLIVGAAPAGSLAALVLARAGHRVALLDRAAFPLAPKSAATASTPPRGKSGTGKLGLTDAFVRVKICGNSHIRSRGKSGTSSASNHRCFDIHIEGRNLYRHTFPNRGPPRRPARCARRLALP